MNMTVRDEDICALVDRQAAAWNRNDAPAWASDFIETARFVNVRGDSIVGRAAIEEIHAFIFSGPYKGSHCTMEIESIQYPAPNVAIVDTMSEVTNFKGLPPGVSATAPGVLRSRPKFILVNTDGKWEIYALQNTLVAPQAMPVNYCSSGRQLLAEGSFDTSVRD